MEKEITNTIIIFTLLDGETKCYFDNFFPTFDITADNFCFLKVNYINTDIPAIIFIKDECIAPNCANNFDGLDICLQNLASELRNLGNTHKYWIYYHKGSDNIDEHKKLIRYFFKECIEFRDERSPKGDEGDHHNKDGFHFWHILHASEAFIKNNEQEFINHLNKLTCQTI